MWLSSLYLKKSTSSSIYSSFVKPCTVQTPHHCTAILYCNPWNRTKDSVPCWMCSLNQIGPLLKARVSMCFSSEICEKDHHFHYPVKKLMLGDCLPHVWLWPMVLNLFDHTPFPFPVKMIASRDQVHTLCIWKSDLTVAWDLNYAQYCGDI